MSLYFHPLGIQPVHLHHNGSEDADDGRHQVRVFNPTDEKSRSIGVIRRERMSNARLHAESGSRLSTPPISGPAATHEDGR